MIRTAPRHAATPTGDYKLLDALAEYGYTHRRGTPKHRKPSHATPTHGWRVDVEAHMPGCHDWCAHYGRGARTGLRRAHLDVPTVGPLVTGAANHGQQVTA